MAGLLEFRLGEAGLDAAGFAVHVPHYLAQAEYPDAAATLVESVAEISGLRLPVGELRAAGEQVRAAVDAQVGEPPRSAEVVRALEEQYDAFVAAPRPLAARRRTAPLPTAEELGAELERFLAQENDRRGRGNDAPDPPSGADQAKLGIMTPRDPRFCLLAAFSARGVAGAAPCVRGNARAPRRGRRPGAACACRRPSIASGVSSLTPAAAVHLDRLVEDPLDGLRHRDLDGLDLGVRALVADGVHQPGGLEHEQPRPARSGPGTAAIQCWTTPWSAIGRPNVDARRRALGTSGRAPARPCRWSRMQWWMRPGPEPRLRDREAVALAADQVRRRHADAVEDDLGVPAVAARRRTRRRSGPARRARRGRPAGTRIMRLLPVPRRVRVRLAHDDEEPAVRVHRAGGPPLAAGDDVLVAVALDPRLDVGGVGASRRPARSCRTRSGSRPSSSGSSHRSCCSGVPNMARTSMFPVSGAEQFIASGARHRAAAAELRERGVLQVGQAGAVLARAGRDSTGRGCAPAP